MPTAERVVIPCPHCNAASYMSREAYLKAAGKTVECPHCRQPCVLGVAGAVMAPEPPQAPPSLPSPIQLDTSHRTAPSTANGKKAKPKVKSARQSVKWIMVWATSLWIVMMPLLALQGHRAVMYGAKLNAEQDAYIQNGQRISKSLLELHAMTDALWKGFIVPSCVYLVAMVFLGVLCFALTPERE